MEFQIGKTLRKKRMMEDISQKQLAQAIGVSHLQISRWEKNKSVPDGRNLLRLMGYLNINPNELFVVTNTARLNNALQHSPPIATK